MKRDFQPAVYIVANKRNGAIYVGVTSNLVQRAWQHREGIVDGFTKRYGITVRGLNMRDFANDVFCQVGLIMLIGMVAKNGILLIDYTNQLRQLPLPFYARGLSPRAAGATAEPDVRGVGVVHV